MRKATFMGALAIVLGGILAAQGPPMERPVLVTNDANYHLQVWRPAANGYEKLWEPRSRSVDPATWEKRRAEAISTNREAPPVIADYNRDGANELLVMDNYGITVYGRNPAYFPFEIASDMGTMVLAVGDADGDQAPEFVTQRQVNTGQESGREIGVWKPTPKGLVSVWKQIAPGYGYALALEDTDNDGQKEIITSADTISILKRRPGPKWESVAELANLGASYAIQVADVDRDGKNELIAGGASGKITVYKYRKLGERVLYPVMWQSRYLLAEGVGATSQGPPSCLTYALATGDVDGDRQEEIIAGTTESGRLGEKDIRSGRIHVFKFDGRRDFAGEWVSDWTSSASAGGLSVGDLDGDGLNEIAFNGREVYKRDAAAGTYRKFAPVCANCNYGMIGALGELSEPAPATRVVPLYWNLSNRQIAEGQTLDITLSLLSVWAEAKDLTVTLAAGNPGLEVAGGPLRIPSVPAGGTITTSSVKLTGRQSGTAPLRLEIAAAGGYRQSVPVQVYVGAPIPTYQQDVESRIAKALAQARDENRRVLIQWGSNNDKASKSLIETTLKDRDVGRTLLYEYELVRAEITGNERVAARYIADFKAGVVPHFTVLDSGSKVLANQPALPFKTEGDGAAAYDGKKLNEFLTKYQATYLDADPLFKAALAQAKKDQKTLFVWFSAPW